MFVVLVQQVRAQLLKTADLPQLQLVEFFGHGRRHARCVPRQMPWVFDVLVQFIDGCGRPCDHAATLVCDSGSATDSVHRWSLWTFQLATETGVSAGCGGDEGCCLPFFKTIFRAPSGLSRTLSASFRSPR